MNSSEGHTTQSVSIPLGITEVEAERRTVVLDYPLPPGTVYDVIGLLWLVRLFGPGKRDMFPCDRFPGIAEFNEVAVSALDDVLLMIRAKKGGESSASQLFFEVPGLPDTWPDRDAVHGVRRIMFHWFTDQYKYLMCDEEETPRNRAFRLAVDVLRRHGWLPSLHIDSAADRVATYARTRKPRFWSNREHAKLLGRESVAFVMRGIGERPPTLRLPSNSGELTVKLDEAECGLRRLANPKAPGWCADVSIDASDRLDAAERSSDIDRMCDAEEAAAVADRIQRLLDSSPARLAAADVLIRQTTLARAAASHGVTIAKVRYAVEILKRECRQSAARSAWSRRRGK